MLSHQAEEGGEGDRERRETSDKSWSRDKKKARELQIMIQTLVEKRWIEI